MVKGRLAVFNPCEDMKIVEWESRDGAPPFKLIQELVGGCFELVSVFYKGQQRDGYYNEEGRCRELPFNEDASRICGHNVVGPFVVHI